MTNFLVEQLRTRSNEKLQTLTNELVTLLVTSGFQEVESFVAVIRRAHDAYAKHLNELELSSLTRLDGLITNLRHRLLGEMLKPVPIRIILAREIAKIHTERSLMTLNTIAFFSGLHPNLRFQEETGITDADLLPPVVTPAVVELMNEYLALVEAQPLSDDLLKPIAA